MQTQQTPSSFEQSLIGYGIEIGLLVSGFFGALLMVGHKSSQKLSSTLISVAAGTACANYLTPVVLHFAPTAIQDGRSKFAAAFVMGFLGLKGLEFVMDKWLGAEVKGKSKTKSNRNTKRNNK